MPVKILKKVESGFQESLKSLVGCIHNSGHKLTLDEIKSLKDGRLVRSIVAPTGKIDAGARVKIIRSDRYHTVIAIPNVPCAMHVENSKVIEI